MTSAVAEVTLHVADFHRSQAFGDLHPCEVAKVAAILSEDWMGRVNEDLDVTAPQGVSDRGRPARRQRWPSRFRSRIPGPTYAHNDRG